MVSNACFGPRMNSCAMCESRGGTEGPDPPLENHKNIVFLILVRIPYNCKATKPAFNIGP